MRGGFGHLDRRSPSNFGTRTDRRRSIPPGKPKMMGRYTILHYRASRVLVFSFYRCSILLLPWTALLRESHPAYLLYIYGDTRF